MAHLLNDQEEFWQRPFTSLTYTQEKLSSTIFDECTFQHCTFNETIFYNCTFIQCEFQECDLSLIQLENCRFNGITFRECKLVGINWSTVAQLKQFELHKCDISYATFMGLDLQRAHITECLAKEVYFSETNLTGAVLTGSDFSNGRFTHNNLTHADFRNAKNYTISPTLNTLKKTKFSMPEAMSLLHTLDIILDEHNS